MIISVEGETGRQGSHDLGILSNTIDEASRGGTPHRQSMLSGVDDKAGVEEGEVVHPTTSKASGSGEGS